MTRVPSDAVAMSLIVCKPFSSSEWGTKVRVQASESSLMKTFKSLRSLIVAEIVNFVRHFPKSEVLSVSKFEFKEINFFDP